MLCQVCSQLQGPQICIESNLLTDWWATHSGATSVNAGLDMTMPGDVTLGSGTTYVLALNGIALLDETENTHYFRYFGSNIVSAVQNGQVSQTRIDDLATRILAAW